MRFFRILLLVFIGGVVIGAVQALSASPRPAESPASSSENLYLGLIIATFVCLVGLFVAGVFGGAQGPRMGHTYGGGW